MSDDNVERVRRAFEALNEGGVEAALALGLYAEDVLIYPTREWPDSEVYRGHSGARRLYLAWADQFDDFRWEVQETRDVGGRVLSLLEMRGRLKDSATPISEPWGVVTAVRDGRISEVQLFRNQREALEAVGLADEA